MGRGGEEAEDEANHHQRKPVDRIINRKAARARAAAVAAVTATGTGTGTGAGTGAGAGSTTHEFIKIV